MLLVEPLEAAGPPCAAPLHLPMSLTKLNFPDYNKVKTYENSDTDNRLNYEDALNVARLTYEQSMSAVEMRALMISFNEHITSFIESPAGSTLAAMLDPAQAHLVQLPTRDAHKKLIDTFHLLS
ncbi:unnamed protein product [Leptidea sinapis]|uniref:Uncharacterized protein n=1 Tax=Leptidea sinapis TaxID=189913 RepID=A0A5E4QU59_9NEOP|nr:unnamed protein product [Leptidea sinapis]